MAERKVFRHQFLVVSPLNLLIQGQIATANKIAMSKALGAAFLNHKVEQLEKSVTNGPASGNWRDRQLGRNVAHLGSPTSTMKSTAQPPNGRRKAAEVITPTRTETPRSREVKPIVESPKANRRSSETISDKDADIIIADSSVLIHGLDFIKKWSRNGREEIVIVPLEGVCHILPNAA